MAMSHRHGHAHGHGYHLVFGMGQCVTCWLFDINLSAHKAVAQLTGPLTDPHNSGVLRKSTFERSNDFMEKFRISLYHEKCGFFHEVASTLFE